MEPDTTAEELEDLDLFFPRLKNYNGATVVPL
jgi:hypothetical protein